MRLGHLIERCLVELAKFFLIRNEKLIKLNFCDHCILGKNLAKVWEWLDNTTIPFEYVHKIYY